jgi:hypothetical protein
MMEPHVVKYTVARPHTGCLSDGIFNCGQFVSTGPFLPDTDLKRE